jgi:hypothetical protein
MLPPLVSVVFKFRTNTLFSPGSRGYMSQIALVLFQTRSFVPVRDTNQN